MSKARQKEMEQLRLQKEKKEGDYRHALKKLIDSEQTLRISLDFSEEYLNSNNEEALEEYTPIHISRLIFDSQLEQIKNELQKMPDRRCKVEHFIVMMLKVMKLPFEKTPLYMVGLKDMFFEISDEGKDTISYQEIFKYVLGELVTLKEQEQNTEFQVQFQERKKQDYLLHDNGLKRVFYSNDVKMVMSLDQRENVIKFYDQDMKNIGKFIPRKDMHQGRMPQILDFDYSELTMRLGIIFIDNTIESIHLPNFINKTQTEFQLTTLNQLIFPTPERMKRVYYIQMINKWLTISQENNHVYLYDMEKVRLKPEQVEEKIHIDNNDLSISMVLEIVTLSTICFIAGNEITFYNENLTVKKFAKFSHHQIITIFKYSQEKNTFYLAGKEKTITIFTINRNHTTFKIWNLQINKIITDFQVFPYFDTILICDESHDIRLIHEPSKNTYQHHSLAHIVKMKDKYLKSYKLSKTEFIIYQTYMLIFGQEKIAIEKEMEFNFLPGFYFDNRKEEMYISVNHQIISFSVLFGEIRKNYSFDTSNITNQEGFYMGSKTHLFILDTHKNIFEIYLKSQQIQGQNRNYRRKVAIGDIVSHFYDEEMRDFMIVGHNNIHQIRNDFNNSFNTINIINFLGFSKIISSNFCTKTKYITFMTSNQAIYQIKNFETKISKSFKLHFKKSTNDHEDKLIIQFEYCPEYQLLILMSNKNEIAIVERLNISNHIFIDIMEHLPFKLRSINFNKFSYHLFKEKNHYMPSILLYDDSGYIFDINLSKLFGSKFYNTKKEERIIKSFLKQSYDIHAEGLPEEELQFAASNKVKLASGDYLLQKVHDKQIAIGTKLKLQIMTTLTISKDGFIKLWNQSYACLFVLKIPTLLKINWNMKQIQNIKNKKSINELIQIINSHYSIKQYKAKPLQIVNKTKRLKHYPEPKKLKFEEDLPLEIESKEIEDIVLQEEDYLKNYQTNRGMRQKLRYNPEMTTLDIHPWRTKREFIKIYEKASPNHKYSQKIPNQIMTLRTSLDMTGRKKKTPNYQVAELILPQLKSYENEKIPTDDKKQKKKEQQKDEFQNFESCMYVKSERRRKRANELDDIDREFFKKEMALQNKRWVPKYRKEKKSNTIDISESTMVSIEQNRYDTMRDIQSVFEQHNRECFETKRGRIINIPKFSLPREYE